jgi:hypothetical protein
MNLRPIRADVLAGAAIRTRPFPGVAEHALVQAAPERLRDRIAPARERPGRGFQDVLLLECVALVPQGDVRGNETLALFRTERGRAGRFGERSITVHGASQSRAGFCSS